MARATPKFSIITTCKGRLEHLKETLPRMIAQKDAEVIVVDYSCPHGTAAWVRENHPDVTVVRLENLQGFSNWRGRNAGAKEAKGEYLIFCDADTVLAPDATDQIAKIINDKNFGFFMLEATEKFKVAGAALSMNQLKGFHVLSSKAFADAKGYDEHMTGYAAGADTDLEDRLRLDGFTPTELDPAIIERVIQHDDKERVRYHRVPVGFSYAAALFYRRAKLAIMSMRHKTSIEEETAKELAQVSQVATKKMLETGKPGAINVILADEALRMPRQLGLIDGRFRISLRLEIIPGKRMPRPKGARAGGAKPAEGDVAAAGAKGAAKAKAKDQQGAETAPVKG